MVAIFSQAVIFTVDHDMTLNQEENIRIVPSQMGLCKHYVIGHSKFNLIPATGSSPCGREAPEILIYDITF